MAISVVRAALTDLHPVPPAIRPVPCRTQGSLQLSSENSQKSGAGQQNRDGTEGANAGIQVERADSPQRPLCISSPPCLTGARRFLTMPRPVPSTNWISDGAFDLVGNSDMAGEGNPPTFRTRADPRG